MTVVCTKVEDVIHDERLATGSIANRFLPERQPIFTQDGDQISSPGRHGLRGLPSGQRQEHSLPRGHSRDKTEGGLLFALKELLPEARPLCESQRYQGCQMV